MSRGLGKLQLAVVKVLQDDGKPMLSMDVASLVWNSTNPPPPTINFPVSFYESVRRAAAGLVKRGIVLSGNPKYGSDGRERSRAIFWLPGKTAPQAFKRIVPATMFEHGILQALADGPKSYSDVVYYVGSRLTKDQYECDHFRVPICRAVNRLTDTGKVRRYVNQDGDWIDKGKEFLSVGL